METDMDLAKMLSQCETPSDLHLGGSIHVYFIFFLGGYPGYRYVFVFFNTVLLARVFPIDGC